MRRRAGISRPGATTPALFKPPENGEKGSDSPGRLTNKILVPALEPVEDFPLLRSKFNLGNTTSVHRGATKIGRKRAFTKIPPVGGPHEGARPHPLPAEMGAHRRTSEPGNSQRLGRRRGRPASAWESYCGGGLGVQDARRRRALFPGPENFSSALWPEGGAEGPDRRPPLDHRLSLVSDGARRPRRNFPGPIQGHWFRRP